MNETKKQPSCEDEVEGALSSRIEDLSLLWSAYQEGDEDRHSDELGNFYEYGLCFDYVPAGTFNDQEEAFHRYQLSYGGPQEEFRYFSNHDLSLIRIEFWYLHWFDGACRVLSGSDKDLMSEIWDFFVEVGSAQAEIDKATG